MLAGLTPFVAWLGRHWNGSVSWPETLVVAFCAGYCARRAVRGSGARDALDAPWLLAMAVVMASLTVHFLIESWRFGGPPTRADLWQLITFDYFISATSGNPVDAAMRLIESLLLFRAAATMTREVPAFAVRLVSWVVCGASAAAGLNLFRLWESAERFGEPWGAFVRLLLTERVNVHYGDLNAAGSYFVMALFAAIGLTMRPKGRPWLVAVLLIGCSVWVTGSRMAVMAGMLAMLLPAIARAWRMRRGSVRSTTLASAALLLALLRGRRRIRHPGARQSTIGGHSRAGALGTRPYRHPDDGVEPVIRSRNRPLLLAVRRVQLARAPRELPAGHPRERTQQLPADPRRARHRRVSQSSCGCSCGSRRDICAGSWRETRTTRLRWSLCTGLLAFVLSWLGGHPLLIDEPSFAFWLLLGAVSGWGASLDTVPGLQLRTWVVPVAIA